MKFDSTHSFPRIFTMLVFAMMGYLDLQIGSRIHGYRSGYAGFLIDPKIVTFSWMIFFTVIGSIYANVGLRLELTNHYRAYRKLEYLTLFFAILTGIFSGLLCMYANVDSEIVFTLIYANIFFLSIFAWIFRLMTFTLPRIEPVIPDHYFCRNCLKYFSVSNDECPICYSKLSKEELKSLWRFETADFRICKVILLIVLFLLFCGSLMPCI
ncbi:MAG: hypothetical protein PHW04_05440 [Candidatus Wallbacteria bacterium]|nr:hypothetical protein [Candidatus Wallbacteria bacterium]